MRHRKRGRKLGRTAAHREALRRNMAKAIIEHERIITTPAKAKEVRPFVERLISLAKRALPFKDGDPAGRARYLHLYRQAFSKLQDKKIVQKLFGEGEWREKESLGQRYAGRNGGYTRIVRLSGSRLGVPVGTTMGEIPVLNYKIAGRERTLRLTGNRLGDNAPQVLFEFVEKEAPVEEEVQPKMAISGERQGEKAAEQPQAPDHG